MNKKYLRVFILYVLTGIAFANTRLIISYKPQVNQTKLANAQTIRLEMMKPLTAKAISKLSTIAQVKITDDHAIATGAHVIYADTDNADLVIERLKQDPDIANVEIDRIMHIATTQVANPNWQWDMGGLGFLSNQSSWIGDNFVGAWQLLQSATPSVSPGQNVIVAVIDTGYTPHPNFYPANLQAFDTNGDYGYQIISDCRFAGSCPTTTPLSQSKISYQPNGLDTGDYTSLTDAAIVNYTNGRGTCEASYGSTSSWHGSHVTGIIAANSYSQLESSYITGGAYGAKVIPIRTLGKCGGYLSDIANAIIWASGSSITDPVTGDTIPGSSPKADIINMSLGGGETCNGSVIQSAINIANQNGSIVVVAAGNNSQNINNYTPAGCSGVVSVASRGPNNKLAPYSNFGATTIAASGGNSALTSGCTGSNLCLSNIYSTIWSSSSESPYYIPPESGGYGTFTTYQGTSQATPHVSAILADVIGYFKATGQLGYSNSNVIETIVNTAESYTNYNNASYVQQQIAEGGTIDAEGAIMYAIDHGVVQAIVPTPESVNFSTNNTTATINFSNTSNNPVMISGVELLDPSGELNTVFQIQTGSTCQSGLTLSASGSSGSSCNVLVRVVNNITQVGELNILDENGFILSSVALSYTANNVAPVPVTNGGGCTMVKGTDDISLVLLLILATLYPILQSYLRWRKK